MTAEIIASTPDATKVVARAAWVCTHAGWPGHAPDKRRLCSRCQSVAVDDYGPIDNHSCIVLRQILARDYCGPAGPCVIYRPGDHGFAERAAQAEALRKATAKLKNRSNP